MPTITDWLMVGITLVYVIATIAIWFANHKSARATEKQLTESKRQYEDKKRLEIMPYFEVQICNNISDFHECIGLALSSQNAGNARFWAAACFNKYWPRDQQDFWLYVVKSGRQV